MMDKLKLSDLEETKYMYFQNTSKEMQIALKDIFGHEYNNQGIITYNNQGVFIRNNPSELHKYIKTTFEDILEGKTKKEI